MRRSIQRILQEERIRASSVVSWALVSTSCACNKPGIDSGVIAEDVLHGSKFHLSRELRSYSMTRATAPSKGLPVHRRVNMLVAMVIL